MLAEELGIDPSPALQELEAAILRQDPRLRPPGGERTPMPGPTGPTGPTGRVHATGPAPPTEAEVPTGAKAVPPGTPFVGREQELGALLDALARARAGVGQLVLVAGEPGNGKTRLVDELLRRAGSTRVAVGRCVEAEGGPPFWPWLQILGALPTFASSAELVPTDATGGRRTIRFAQALEVADVLRRAGEQEGLAVVLEDLQWADPASPGVPAAGDRATDRRPGVARRHLPGGADRPGQRRPNVPRSGLRRVRVHSDCRQRGRSCPASPASLLRS
jgi:hypothetical protein